MHVKVSNLSSGQIFDIKGCSKAMPVKKFKKLVSEAVGIKTSLINLIFGGKFLNDEDDLLDYKIEAGYTIMLQTRQALSPVKKSVENTVAEEKEEVLTPAEEKRRLEEIGALEFLREMENEEQHQPEGVEEICKKCKNNETKKCKECGCSICGGKNNPERQLFCEQCQYTTHMECLDEPLDTIPEGDWYCPDCFNDPSQIVGKGERVKYSKARAKMPSRVKVVKRDWGRGYATAGRTKTCTKVPKDHFGPIPGIDVGMSWQFRIQASEAGVHLPPVGGIAGKADVGCQSIVLAGGYEDDEDNGDEVYYTGSGGRDLSGNKRTSVQSFDQELTKFNKAIAVSCNAKFNDQEGAEAKDWKKGKAIRVLRSYKLQKHSKYAPDFGVRYDGIYKVVKYWPQRGKSGFIVWRYLFRRDDPSPAPWEKGAKKYKCIMKEKEDETSKKRKADDIEGELPTKKAKDDEEVEEVYQVEKHLLDLIKADSAKKIYWDECLRFKGPKNEFFDFVEKTFECFGCMEIVKKPVNFPCNHNACLACLKKSFKNDHFECWFCRADIGKDYDLDANVNAECDKALRTMFS